ncbi:MAG: alpha/beta hydrolase [Saprospiraceae bacterium]|nr:alpha/beta hydrolase [Saprospiraceae bacterium]
MNRLQPLFFKSLGLGLNLYSLLSTSRAADAALRIFGTPPRPRLRPKELDFLSTARQVRRTAAGREIMEYHWGEPGAPLVLLSYGWGYNAGRWRHFVPTLVEGGWRVIAYDPSGHGLAPRDFMHMPLNAAIITDLIQTYGPTDAIIGHSFGGSSSVYAVHRLPAQLRPRKMVIMASFTYIPQVFKDYQKALGIWPTLYWPVVRKAEQMLGDRLDQFDLARMSGDFDGIEALLVHDPGDPVTPFSHAQRFHNFWPESALLAAKGAHHHLGHPEVTEAVLQFVQTGALPAAAQRQERPEPPGHELVRYFAGL